VPLEDLANGAAMLGEQTGIVVGTFVKKAGRAFDVSEEEGDGPRRERYSR